MRNDRPRLGVIVSTGALMAHGFVEGSGRSHFKYDPRMNDLELFERGYDRVYDTLELEKNLDEIDLVRDIVDSMPDDKTLSSHRIMHALGGYLDRTLPDDTRAILKSCYRKNVPVYVPAFTGFRDGSGHRTSQSAPYEVWQKSTGV
ncbi:MAG: deoxyhypusine synthase family protein [Myxococcota bacterium]